MNLESYLDWAEKDCILVHFQRIAPEGGNRRRKRQRTEITSTPTSAFVPTAYAGVIDQFVAEWEHATEDNAHEALRRQAYVEEMLDLVALELLSYDGDRAEYRSKILTPVLQRHLCGIPDAYGPTVRRAMQAEGKSPTIREVTKFYLNADPVDPIWIPSYRYGAIRIPELRWYVKVLVDGPEAGVIGDVHVHRNVMRNQELMMQRMAEAGDSDDVEPGVPRLTAIEVEIIICEQIDIFFLQELMRVVGQCRFHLSSISLD